MVWHVGKVRLPVLARLVCAELLIGPWPANSPWSVDCGAGFARLRHLSGNLSQMWIVEKGF